METTEKIAPVIPEAPETESTRNSMLITIGLIVINVLIFIAMAIAGAGIFESDVQKVIDWGASFAPLIVQGEWWRIFTCIFLHFGIFHLAMNMYALFMAGVYLEPMLGRVRFIVAYTCTGLLSGIVSLWWHRVQGESATTAGAGASGAIFGLYGVFLALLLTNLIPKQLRQTLLQSIGIFIVYNLFYGLKGGVDNAAHIGGLLSGIIIGFVFYLVLKSGDARRSNWMVVGTAAVTLLACWLYLAGSKQDQNIKLANTIEAFIKLEEKAQAAIQPGEPITAATRDSIKMISIPAYTEGIELLNAVRNEELSAAGKTRKALLTEYARLRKDQMNYYLSDAPADTAYITNTEKRATEIIEKLKVLNQ